MTARSLRTTLAPDPHEPVLLDLPTITYAGKPVTVRLLLRLDEQRVWRGRLRFQAEGVDVPRDTFEIFRGEREQELWESVQSLREHHFRDLYRSLD